MRIGELAIAAQCTVETIRFYEKEGLLAEPLRTSGNYRCYGSEHVRRLRFIRNCRALDMAHEEIRALLNTMDLPSGDCASVNQLVEKHIEHVDVRIDELLELKRQLAALRELCQIERSVEACGILHGLAAMETEAKPARPTHLG
jgi:Cd(II)/Pb(II)-responsive transcriptional regulator